jgi:hypothetical protein
MSTQNDKFCRRHSGRLSAKNEFYCRAVRLQTSAVPTFPTQDRFSYQDNFFLIINQVRNPNGGPLENFV